MTLPTKSFIYMRNLRKLLALSYASTILACSQDGFMPDNAHAVGFLPTGAAHGITIDSEALDVLVKGPYSTVTTPCPALIGDFHAQL